MKTVVSNIFFSCLLLGVMNCANAQIIADVDSLKRELLHQQEDTNKVKIFYNLSFSYAASYADSALMYGRQALDLADRLNYEDGKFWAHIVIAGALGTLGNYPLSLEYDFRALALANKLNDPLKLCYANGSLSDCYYYLGEYETSLAYERKVVKLIESLLR